MLIGEDSHVNRVPVHRGFLAIHKASGIQLQEQCLFMAIIFRLARREFARPVDRKAKPFQLRFHICDVVAGPVAGVDILFHCRVFGRHAKGVPTHGVKHLMTGHPLIAR